MQYRGVFFDWFNTLSGYETPRESLYQKAFQKFGIELNVRTIYKGIQRGDRYYYSKSAPLKPSSNTPEALARYYCLYPQFIVDEARLDVPVDIQLKVVQQALTEFIGNMILYSDVLPLIQSLKKQPCLVGVITNADKRAHQTIRESAVGSLVDTIVTSEEAHSEKPDPASG